MVPGLCLVQEAAGPWQVLSNHEQQVSFEVIFEVALTPRSLVKYKERKESGASHFYYASKKLFVETGNRSSTFGSLCVDSPRGADED